MKIRSGYVSNSSSSSFCIYGATFDYAELMEKVEKFFTEDELEELEDDPYLLEEKLCKKTDLAIFSSEGESFWIGKSWADIGDDETGGQFKESVKEEIEKLLGPDIDCDTYEEEIYS